MNSPPGVARLFTEQRFSVKPVTAGKGIYAVLLDSSGEPLGAAAREPDPLGVRSVLADTDGPDHMVATRSTLRTTHGTPVVGLHWPAPLLVTKLLVSDDTGAELATVTQVGLGQPPRYRVATVMGGEAVLALSSRRPGLWEIRDPGVGGEVWASLETSPQGITTVGASAAPDPVARVVILAIAVGHRRLSDPAGSAG